MKFKYLEDVAIADICFEAYGKDVNELFENCGFAITDCMVNLKEVKPKVKKKIKLESDTLENLLYDFLSELLFIKDTDGFLFSNYKINVKQGKKFSIIADCSGNKIDYEKFELRNDIKAITKHMFEIKKNSKGYMARVVVDI